VTTYFFPFPVLPLSLLFSSITLSYPCRDSNDAASHFPCPDRARVDLSWQTSAFSLYPSLAYSFFSPENPCLSRLFCFPFLFLVNVSLRWYFPPGPFHLFPLSLRVHAESFQALPPNLLAAKPPSSGPFFQPVLTRDTRNTAFPRDMSFFHAVLALTCSGPAFSNPPHYETFKTVVLTSLTTKARSSSKVPLFPPSLYWLPSLFFFFFLKVVFQI